MTGKVQEQVQKKVEEAVDQLVKGYDNTGRVKAAGQGPPPRIFGPLGKGRDHGCSRFSHSVCSSVRDVGRRGGQIFAAGVMASRWAGRLTQQSLERQTLIPPVRMYCWSASAEIIVMLFAVVFGVADRPITRVAGIGVAGVRSGLHGRTFDYLHEALQNG